MKKLMCILFLCTGIFAPSAFGQDSQPVNKELISRFRPGVFWFYTGLRPAKTEKVRKYDRLIMDVFYGTWNGKQTAFQHGWTSIGFNTNLIFDIPLVKENWFSLGIGASYNLTRLQHDHIFSTDSTGTYTTYVTDNIATSFERQTLISHKLAIPLELRFRTKGWKHVKFHIGGKLGYNLALLNKSIDNDPGDRFVVKDYQFVDKQPFSYSAHMRIGIRNWALFGSYQFSSLFKDARSPQFHIVQLGMSVSLF